ncbi:MAG TPA: hypothetical protein PLO67_13770 [Saprospiraceae bacterium]|nr:hypothetical protein [Saprospiraceae bacterium]HPI06168.1 hypothetical protein [Saprospiraceae bacterium]
MQQNFSQYFRSLQILFSALLVGQIVVMVIIYNIQEPPAGDMAFKNTVAKWLPLLLIVQAGLAFFLNRTKLETARSKSTIEEKLEDYRIASVLKWALLEGGTLISIVLFFVWGPVLFFYYAIIMAALFATQFPSRQRLINELDISANEQMILDDPNAMIAQSKRYTLPHSH